MPIAQHKVTGAEPQTLDEIREWRDGVLEALRDQRVFLHRAIRDGSIVAPRFTAMTEDDVTHYFNRQRRELDRLTMLNLVASTEAEIVEDFFRRVSTMLKDTLSRSYQDWYNKLPKSQQRRPPFDEQGILSQLKGTGLLDKNIVGQFRECLQVRHWVGHGRRFKKPIGVDRFDPEDVHERCMKLLMAMPS